MRIAIFGLGYVGTVTAAGLASRRSRGSRGRRRPRQGRPAARRPQPRGRAGHRRADRVRRRAGTAHRDHRPGGCTGAGGRVPALCRHPLEAPGRHRPGLPAPGAGGHPRRDGGRHPAGLRLSRGRGAQHGSAGYRRRAWSARPSPARTPVAGWEIGTAMCPEFLREGSGVADFFNPPMVVVGTANRRVADQLTEMLVLPGPRDPAGRRPHRRGAEVRLQRLPRREGLLRQRAGPDLPDVRRRLARGDAGLHPGQGPQHLSGVPDARVRVRRLVPAQGPAGPAGHGADERPRRPAAARHAADQRAGHRRRRGPADRQPVPHGRHARPQLQDEHRRPAREPERRAGRAAARQGLRGQDLRPDREPGAPDGLQPALHREPAAASAPAARRAPRRRRSAGAEAAIVATSDGAALDELRSAPPEFILDLHGRLGADIERLPAYEGVGWSS